MLESSLPLGLVRPVLVLAVWRSKRYGGALPPIAGPSAAAYMGTKNGADTNVSSVSS